MSILRFLREFFFPETVTTVFQFFPPFGQKGSKLESKYKACELLKNVGFSPVMGSALHSQKMNNSHWSSQKLFVCIPWENLENLAANGAQRGEQKCLLQYIQVPAGKWHASWHRSYCSPGAFFFSSKLFGFKFLNLSKPNPVQKNFCSSSRDTRAVSGKCHKIAREYIWSEQIASYRRGCFRANDATKLLAIIKKKLSKPLRQK